MMKTTGQGKLRSAVVDMIARRPAIKYLDEAGRISVNFCKRYIAKNKVKPAKTSEDASYKKGYTIRLVVTGRGKMSITHANDAKRLLVGTPVKYMAINRERGYEFLFIYSDSVARAKAIDTALLKRFFII